MHICLFPFFNSVTEIFNCCKRSTENWPERRNVLDSENRKEHFQGCSYVDVFGKKWRFLTKEVCNFCHRIFPDKVYVLLWGGFRSRNELSFWRFARWKSTRKSFCANGWSPHSSLGIDELLRCFFLTFSAHSFNPASTRSIPQKRHQKIVEEEVGLMFSLFKKINYLKVN